MKAIFTTSEVLSNCHSTDDRKLLYGYMRDRLGFEIVPTEIITPEMALRYDTIFFVPRIYLRKRAYENTMRVCDIPRSRLKIMAYCIDIDLPSKHNPSYAVDDFRKGQKKVLQRADMVVGGMKQYLFEQYGGCVNDLKNKYLFWPKAVYDVERYKRLPLNSRPIMKCFICGKAKKEYPLRLFLYNNGGNLIHYLGHPGYTVADPNECFLGDKFAKELNRYACGFCGSKVWNYVLEKHVIIPAAGLVLIATRIADLDDMGHMPGEHYVEVNKDNVLEKIKAVIDNYGDYQDMRRRAREFVFANHTVDVRLEKLKKAMVDFL